MVVWHKEGPSITADQIRHTTLHELMHIVVPIGHRTALDTRLATDSGLSVVDEELIRLHSHPLIRPGMTVDEIEDLIVLNEDLLDPQAVSPYWQAHEVLREVNSVLQEASSVRLQVSGEWSGFCGSHRVDRATYELGDIKDGLPSMLRFRTGDVHHFIVQTYRHGEHNHWTESGNRWMIAKEVDVFGPQNWRGLQWSPYAFFRDMLRFGKQ